MYPARTRRFIVPGLSGEGLKINLCTGKNTGMLHETVVIQSLCHWVNSVVVSTVVVVHNSASRWLCQRGNKTLIILSENMVGVNVL